MPNILRRIPRNALGLRMTTTCIYSPPFCFLFHPMQAGSRMFRQKRMAQSAMASTTTSAPLRVEMAMVSDPAAYSLLTPSG